MIKEIADIELEHGWSLQLNEWDGSRPSYQWTLNRKEDFYNLREIFKITGEILRGILANGSHFEINLSSGLTRKVPGDRDPEEEK